jgi:sugar lactone lactonase YvrE
MRSHHRVLTSLVPYRRVWQASGLCFGGPSLSELLVTAGDTLWSVQTNTQGVSPPSADFMKRMEKMAAEGEFRHVGW